MGKPIDKIAFALCTLAVVATAVSSADGGHWVSDLVANLRLHLGVLCLLSLAYFVCRQLWLPTVIAALSFAANVGLANGALASGAASPTIGGQSLRIITLNVSKRNDDFGRVLKYLSDEAADVVVIQEVTPELAGQLAALDALYPHAVVEPRDSSFGIAMLSRHEPRKKATRYFDAGGIPYVEMQLQLRDMPITFIGVHLSWPVEPQSFRARNAQLAELIRLGATARNPVVVCGDFNLTVWSDWFSVLRTDGRFANVFAGVAAPTTWPSTTRWGGISIDHCVGKAGVSIEGRQVGPPVGSDHLPVLFELYLNEVAERR